MGSTNTCADISGLVKHLRDLEISELHDEAARKSLFEAARDVAFALETPGDSVQRIAYTV